MLPQNKRNKVLEKFGLKGERASGRNGLGGSCFLLLPLLFFFFFMVSDLVSLCFHYYSCFCNILPKDYIGRTLSNNGITAVINSDGSVTANGTADENDGSFINLTPYKEWFITEETAMFSGSPQGLALGLNTTARMILETVQPNGSAAHNGSPTEVTPSYVTGVIPKGSIVKRVYLSTAAGYTMDNVTFYPQLEYGTAITEFSSPSVDIEGVNVTVSDGENTQTGTADADGNVSGLMSLAPSMTLVTDNAGAVIECAYNRDTNKVIEELTNAIISLGGNI